MANATPSKVNPSVQHNFEGDARILNATLERRTELRAALNALARDLQRIEGCPAQIKAEIKLQVGGNTPKEHVYKISLTDQGFNVEDFARAVPQSDGAPFRSRSLGAAGSPQTGTRTNGQQATPGLSTPQAESHRTDIDDDVVEIRPFKRQKTSTSGETPAKADPAAVAGTSQPPVLADPPETMAYLRDWHEEWVRQGGWLFDTLTKTQTVSNGIRGAVEKKMEAVQDVLGQSINASSAGTMAELGSITKLIHWLEHCRKTSADKIQAREEKWRSSSATFHDQTRREREAAEKRLEKKLGEQTELLRQIARANGIEAGKADQHTGGSDERSREASLGAQLTAELNMEAGRHGDREDEPYPIDD